MVPFGLIFGALAVSVGLSPLVAQGFSLDFAAPLTFLALLVPTLKSRANVAAAVSADLLAGLVAGIVAWRLRNTWLTIAAGMLALWLLTVS